MAHDDLVIQQVSGSVSPATTNRVALRRDIWARLDWKYQISQPLVCTLIAASLLSGQAHPGKWTGEDHGRDLRQLHSGGRREGAGAREAEGQ